MDHMWSMKNVTLMTA